MHSLLIVALLYLDDFAKKHSSFLIRVSSVDFILIFLIDYFCLAELCTLFFLWISSRRLYFFVFLNDEKSEMVKRKSVKNNIKLKSYLSRIGVIISLRRLAENIANDAKLIH